MCSAISSTCRPSTARSFWPRRSTRHSSIARPRPAKCASPPPNSASLNPRSPPPPTAHWRSNSRFSTVSPHRSPPPAPRSKKRRPRWRCSMSRRRLPRLRSSAITFAPRSTTAWPSPLPAAVIRSSSRRSPRMADRSSPMIAICRRRNAARRKAAGRIWLITGPNMAGKSTFLRQNALIAVLAQTGSFVPAKAAHIGVVDRLFSRVGAADDLARGHSTFMVEMVETAAILNQAGERALVILDEIGRGTATFDGLSIAWATIEHLHENNRCRALFATHFPRNDRALGQAQAAAQRHDAGEGMAGRRRVPARGRGGSRRPFLRHPGGETRRPPPERDRARQGRAGADRSRGPHLADAATDRRSAAVRRRAPAQRRRKPTPH